MVLFPEEQLNSPVGYFPGRLGTTLQDGKWRIIGKLGWGARSSTWLVVDSIDPTEVRAIKVFTVQESQGAVASNELEVLQQIKGTASVSWLQDHFYERSPKGNHLCLVFHPYGRTIESLRQSNTEGGYVALHIAKQIAAQALGSLADLHQKNILHGAVTADHFLLGMLDAEDVQASGILATHASDSTAELIEEDGTVYPMVRSQPLEPVGCDSKWNENPMDFVEKEIFLINLGHSQRMDADAGQETVRDSRAPIAPETLAGGDPGLRSDIWQFGCMIFHLITGTHFLDETYLASPTEFITRNLSEMEGRLSAPGTLAAEDIPLTASFLRACLALDPAHRPNDDDVFDHDWVKGGDLCSCGWCADKD